MANEVDPFAELEASSAGVSPETDPFAELEATAATQEVDPFAKLEAQAEDPFAQLEATTTTPQKSPDWISEPLTKQDIANIATKYGLQTREQIDSLITQAYLRGGTVEGETRPAQYAVGLASDLLLPGDIPAFAQKKLQADENVRKAMDDISSLVEQKKSTARAVGEFAGGLAVPGLGVAGALGKATRVAGKVGSAAAVGATFGAAGGLAESQEGQEAQGAAIGAGLGAALGAGTGALGKWVTARAEQKAVDLVEKIKTGDAEYDSRLLGSIKARADEAYDPQMEAAVLGLKAADEAGEKVPGKLAEEVLQQKKELLAYAHSGDTDITKRMEPAQVDSAINALIHNHGVDHVAEMYQHSRLVKAAEQVQDAVKFESLDKVYRSTLTNLIRPFESAMYMADRIDRMTGSNFNAQINSISRKLNEYKNTSATEMAKVSDLISQMHTEAKAQGKTFREINDAVYKTLNGDDTDIKVSQPLVDNWAKFWEEARQLNNKIEGEEVIKQWGDKPGMYVPHATIDVPKAVEKIQQRLFYFEDTLPQFRDAMQKVAQNKPVSLDGFIESIQDASHKEEFLDLIKAVRHVNSGEDIPLTLNQVVNIVETISHNPSNALRVGEMAARSAKARQGGTPDLIRETDMAKLAERYILNTLKQAYIGREAGQMKAEIMALSKAGFDKEFVQDIANLIQDIEVGVRVGTFTQKLNDSITATSIRARKNAVIAERQGRPVAAKWNRVVANAPQVMQYLGNQIYPNTLGIFTNQRSPLKNLFQPFMMTSPEVGFRYAIPEVMRGVAYALKNTLNGKATKELKEMGLHGEMWESILSSELTNQELPKSVRAFMDANQKASQVAMAAFSQSEVINRYAAMRLGHKVGTDLAAAVTNPGKLDFNQTTAVNYMNNLLDADKRKVEAKLRDIINAPEEAKPKLIKELQVDISQDLIQRTIFDYNKANASIIARSLPAPLLVFTKFPTYLASDIVHKLQTKPGAETAAALTRAYMSPWVLATVIDKIGEDNMQDDDNVINFMLGKEGLSGITNLGGLGGFRSFGNPIISAPFKAAYEAAKVTEGIVTGDEEAIGKAATKAGKEAVTAAGMYGPVGLTGPVKAFYKYFMEPNE